MNVQPPWRRSGGFLNMKHATQQLHSWHSPHGKENSHRHQNLDTNVHSSNIYKRKNWKQCRCPSLGNDYNPWPENIPQKPKGTSHSNSDDPPSCWRRKDRLQKSHSTSSVYVTRLRWQNCQNGGKIIGSQESVQRWEESSVAIKGQRERSLGDGILGVSVALLSIPWLWYYPYFYTL